WIQNELVEGVCPWSLRDKTMTILGLGSIGQEVARRAYAFDIKVTAVRRRAGEPKPSFVERVVGPHGIHEALRGCDLLVIAAAFLPSTDRLTGWDQMALLNRGAILVNVARGKIVDQAAMIAALQSGQLGG